MTGTVSAGLLLHVCCAPCAAGCVERLLAAGRRVTLYYSNSNIATEEEFERRLAPVRRLAGIFGLELLTDPHDHGAWLRQVAGLESEPERGGRCPVCFGFSLGRAAAKAEELGLNFATSLTVSPHKSSGTIFEIGGRFPHFEPHDFKKKEGFRRSRELARLHGFYLQDFCGCEFSGRKP